MAKPKIINVGDKFSYLTILKELQSKNKKRRFLVKCQCGKIKEVSLANLLNGGTKSCGCMKGKKHNLCKTQLFKVWVGIKQRCNNPNCSTYHNYGGKGIKVCDEWNKDFLSFYNWSINNGYKEEKLPSGKNKYTIDRIDGKKDYTPDNCRWVTYNIQATNTSMLSTNSSGYKGISWNKRTQKWLCNISINNKTKRIGEYKTQKEAVYARNKFIEDNNLPHYKNTYIGEIGHMQNKK